MHKRQPNCCKNNPETSTRPKYCDELRGQGFVAALIHIPDTGRLHRAFYMAGVMHMWGEQVR
ncbi:hypothetical protein NUITMVS3_08710 [Shewanella xiamenensis]|nr:hypothetical protein NUITMVS2_11610 [Shewanella xiamenensis]GLD76440.1 hypothetical protein NUITMVS3_08710 [Shewanella xiamenensis]